VRTFTLCHKECSIIEAMKNGRSHPLDGVLYFRCHESSERILEYYVTSTQLYSHPVTKQSNCPEVVVNSSLN
jgi:hypothetical protein